MKFIYVLFLGFLVNVSSVDGQEEFVRDLFKTFADEDPTKFDKMSSFSKEEFQKRRPLSRKGKQDVDNVAWRHYLRDRYITYIIFSERGVNSTEIVVDSVDILDSRYQKDAFGAKVNYHTSEHTCSVTMYFAEVGKERYRLLPMGKYPECQLVTE